MNEFACRVCGLELSFRPWGEDGMTASWEICPCCGIEFGFEDESYESTKRARRKWLSGGANWLYPADEPEDWDLAEQLSNVIYERKLLLEALKLIPGLGRFGSGVNPANPAGKEDL